MPRIFDNIEQSLLPALRETIQVANRADFCMGYSMFADGSNSTRILRSGPGERGIAAGFSFECKGCRKKNWRPHLA